MSQPLYDKNKRILIVDDDPDIWKTYESVLSPGTRQISTGRKILGMLKKDVPEEWEPFDFHLDFAAQGDEALGMIEQSVKRDDPFALAIIDIRMPPGWDGVETASRIRQIDPNIEIVIITAYSDFSRKEMAARIGSPEKLLLLRKPFDLEEFEQIALSLTEKWNLARQENIQRNELQTVLTTTPAAIFTIDRDKIIRSWNPAAERMTGFPCRDVIDRPCIFADEMNGRICVDCIIDFDNPSNISRNIDFTDTDGITRTISKRVAFIRDKRGVAVKAVETFWDITAIREAEKALRDSEVKFRGIFENAMDGIFQSLPEGWLITVNSAFARMFGYDSPSNMIENVTNIGDQLFANSKKRNEFLKLMTTKGFVKGFETRLRKKDGGLLTVAINAWAVYDEKTDMTYFEGIVDDITQRKRMERLKIAKDAAESATRSKSEFLANMSHEIRTPINAVLGFTDLALKTELPVKPRVYLEKIRSSARILLDIIDDILDFSKVEAGKLELEQEDFQLSHVINNLYDMFSHQAEQKNIRMVVSISEEIPDKLNGDRLRLGQVLTNLTDNAFKFTGEGEIAVTVALVEKDTKSVVLRFSIRDTGIGLSGNEITGLFDPFTQADSSTTRKYGGTGLGLAICKRLVEMMAGQIWAESEPGKGATFYFIAKFSLPAERKKLIPESPAELRGIKILAVDDDRGVLDFMRAILKKFLFVPEISVSGAEALDRLSAKEEKYDLIITDWIMPEMDGIELTRRIRETPRLAGIPIIMLTGSAKEPMVRQAKEAGVNAFTSKPVDYMLLFDTIMDVFGKKEKKSAEMPEVQELDPQAKEKLAGTRVLLVEDNDINQALTSEILEDAGIFVDLAENGLDAVRAVDSRTYDAVLMDVQMPEMDGYEAVRLIRRNIRNKDLPIIAMTAHVLTGVREKCFEAGMNDYVAKPIEIDQLLSTLSRWICPDPNRETGKILPPGPGNEKKRTIPDLPGINLENGLKRHGKDEILYRKLLKKFCQQYSDAVTQVKKAMENGDIQSVLRMAHTIKGLAGNFSATDLYKAASELEEGVRLEITDHFDKLVAVFEETLNQVIEAEKMLAEVKMETVEPKEKSDEEIIPDRSAVEPVLVQLAGFLKEDDLEAEECLETLKGAIGNYGKFRRDLELLDSYIGEYNFERAFSPLSKIAQAMEISLEEK